MAVLRLPARSAVLKVGRSRFPPRRRRSFPGSFHQGLESLAAPLACCQERSPTVKMPYSSRQLTVRTATPISAKLRSRRSSVFWVFAQAGIGILVVAMEPSVDWREECGTALYHDPCGTLAEILAEAVPTQSACRATITMLASTASCRYIVARLGIYDAYNLSSL